MASFIDVFNHLVLPPKLPGTQDADPELTSDDVLGRLLHAIKTIERLAGQQQASAWQATRGSLHRYRSLHVRGRLDKQSLISEFRNIGHEQPLILHIVEQNVALIIQRNVRQEARLITT